jgi:RHS repeat-associated protein
MVNADKPRSSSGQGVPVPGGRITLTSLDVSGLTFSASVDANGLAQLTQIPSGNYAWNATAQGFQGKSGTIIIEPGVLNKHEELMATATVSYDWSVTPTSVQDRYNISLNLTFKTDVPAPALVADPPLIDLAMAGGQTAYSQYTITNKGLVSAFNVAVNINPGDDAIKVEVPFTSIPEIKPGQSVSVPMKITLVHASCHSTVVENPYEYDCAAGLKNKGSGPQVRMTAGSCNASSTANPAAIPPPFGTGGGLPVSGAYVPLAVTKPSVGEDCAKPHLPPPSHARFCLPCVGANMLSGALHWLGTSFGLPPGSMPITYQSWYNSDGTVNPDGSANNAGSGNGWSNPDTNVKIGADTRVTVTRPDGSAQILVPLHDLKQNLSGSGQDFDYPAGNLYQISYDPSGNVFVMVDPNGIKTNFVANGQVSSVVDPNGNTLTYTRDGGGAVQKIQDNHGRSLSFSYGNNGGPLSGVADNNASQDRTSETDANGDVTQYEYDASHRMTKITYPNGGHTFYTYNAAGKIATQSDDGGNNALAFSYFSSSATVVDALNNTTKYDYVVIDGASVPVRVTDPAGNITAIEYTDLHPSKVTDTLGRVSKASYDAFGQLASATDAAGNVIQVANGNVNGLTAGAAGSTPSPTQNPAVFRPTAIKDAKGNGTSLRYDTAGNLTGIIDALNNDSEQRYDLRGHLVDLQDPLGNISHFTYNDNGAMTSIRDTLGRTTQLVRDGLSRVTGITSPANQFSQFEYDAEGNLTKVTDPLNGVTQFHYFAGQDGRLLNSIKDPNGHSTTLAYDSSARLTSVANPLGQARIVAYDKNGNVTTLTDANNRTITFEYDSLGQRTKVHYPEGDITYTYDGLGNLTQVAHYNGSIVSLTYDNVSRVTQSVKTFPGGYSATLSYSYDTNGNTTRISSPWGTFSYAYDAGDRPTSVTNPQGQAFTFRYNSNSGRTKLTYPNGIEATYVYDAANQIIQIVHRRTSDSTALAFQNYLYDAVGNMTSMADMAGTHSYAYDNLLRLVGAMHPPMSVLPIKGETFGYDATGNRLSDSASTNYSYDVGDRIVQNSETSYTHDANGNRLTQTEKASGQQTIFTWNSLDQLTRVIRPDGVTIDYKYDGFGYLIEKNVSSTTVNTTRYVRSGPAIIALLDGANTVTALFTYGQRFDEPLSMHNGSADVFFHADVRGSVVAVSDASGQVVERAEYTAYGQPVFTSVNGSTFAVSQVGATFGYVGVEWADELGFSRNGLRYLDPATGRFISEEPLAYQGPNRYLYAGNRPTMLADRDGAQVEHAQEIGKIIIPAIPTIFFVPPAVVVIGAAVVAGLAYVAWKDSQEKAPAPGAGGSGKGPRRRCPNLGRKLDYLFGLGKDKPGATDTHNSDRSKSMLAKLNEAGITDTPENRALVTQHLTDALNDDGTILGEGNKYPGTIWRKSTLAGPNGSLILQTLWFGDDLMTPIIKVPKAGR